MLERKSAHLLGRTVRENIQRVRTEQAKEYPLETRHPVPIVAERCGFQEARRMNLAFRKLEALPPSSAAAAPNPPTRPG